MLSKIKNSLKVKEDRIGKFNLLLIGAVALVIVISIGQIISQKIIQIGLNNSLPQYQITDSVFIDQNSASKEELGTPLEPFKRILTALEFAKKNPKVKNIYINTGTYNGILEIQEGINLYAYNPETLILNKTLDDKTLTLKGNNIIRGLTVQGGRYAIHIPEEAKNIKINSCTIKEASWFGIYNEEHPEANEEYKLEVINSTITGNYRQGLYLQKGTFVMSNSTSTKNGEEGVDLHMEMNTTIDNCTISNNGEGGIETELGNINLSITNSTIEGNKSSGINLQSNTDNSIVIIENNSINNNSNFGIRCALHSPIKSPYFTKAFETYPSRINTFSGNQASIDPNCLR